MILTGQPFCEIDREWISCDSKVEIFYNINNKLIEIYIPLKTSSHRDFSSWFRKKLNDDQIYQKHG